jgi:hypothetical protein
MRTAYRISLALLSLFLASTAAMAQRRYMPIAELIDVPTTVATSKIVTPEQLRGAVIAAALAAEWDAEPQPDGTLLLTYFKDLNFKVVLRATFAETSYSLRYVSSDRMSETSLSRLPPYPSSSEPLPMQAKRWREGKSDRAPDFRYAVDRPDLVIHQDYEVLLYELSAGVRRHLRLL